MHFGSKAFFSALSPKLTQKKGNNVCVWCLNTGTTRVEAGAVDAVSGWAGAVGGFESYFLVFCRFKYRYMSFSPIGVLVFSLLIQ